MQYFESFCGFAPCTPTRILPWTCRGAYSAFRLSCLWLIDLSLTDWYSKVSMSIVLNVLFHCSAKKIRPEFLNPFSMGGGGGGGEGMFPSPSLSIDRFQTFWLLTFKFCYRAIISQKIKFITCQGVTWSLFSQKHLPHAFHNIYIEFSSSTFSCFWHLYLVFWLSKYQNIEIY